MTDNIFRSALLLVIVLFTGFFILTILPPLFEEFDVLGALAAGFVNPYAAGYSTDVIMCWFALAFWVIRDAKVYSIRHGWVCLLLGLVPGVAVGLSLYLILRLSQLKCSDESAP